MIVPKSWIRYYVAVCSVFNAPDDPEDTLMVALTRRELSMVVLGLITGCQLFPETAQDGMKLIDKFEELIGAQEFGPRPLNEGEEDG